MDSPTKLIEAISALTNAVLTNTELMDRVSSEMCTSLNLIKAYEQQHTQETTKKPRSKPKAKPDDEPAVKADDEPAVTKPSKSTKSAKSANDEPKPAKSSKPAKPLNDEPAPKPSKSAKSAKSAKPPNDDDDDEPVTPPKKGAAAALQNAKARAKPTKKPMFLEEAEPEDELDEPEDDDE